MTRKVNVIGVGMVPFAKPGESEEYNVMASKAGRAALEDAKVPFGEVQQAYAGYVFGDSTCGQRAVYEIGLTGIPVFNVNNTCSTGSSALMLAAQAVAGGLAEKPELAKELGAIVLFKLVDPGSEWTVEGAAVSPADFGTAKTTFTLKDEDLAALSAGDVYGLYQHGKLRVDGDVSVAHRLGLLKGLL